IDFVLDASGFAFSTQWGAAPAVSLLKRMNKRYRRKQPLVLLPQALGPFNDPTVSDMCRALFARAELVCARDQQSLEQAEKLRGTTRLVKYPDFTLTVDPILPSGIELPTRFSVIVPNCRMLDKSNQAGEYRDFLRYACELL